MGNIGASVRAVRARIEDAAKRTGRSPSSVTLMAVTKTVGADRVREAIAAGVGVVGENRVQEAEAKVADVGREVAWHLIGKLQSNKARRAAGLFDAIHSVDRMSLVRRLDRAAAERPGPLDVYVQVEFARTGATEAQIEVNARDVCDAVLDSPALRLVGLMTLPPFDPDPETARPYFQRLRRLRDAIGGDDPDGTRLGLSMGMSGDFEVAVEEGATIVRVGSVLFGERDKIP